MLIFVLYLGISLHLSDSKAAESASYILTDGLERMAEIKNGRAKPIVLWSLAAILLIIVFFAVRRLTREELPLRVARQPLQDLITTAAQWQS